MRPGGYYGPIIGDVPRGRAYSSYQADLVTRMPKKELAAVLIKGQHNVASKSTDYPLRSPRIMHEYVVLWQTSAIQQHHCVALTKLCHDFSRLTE